MDEEEGEEEEEEEEKEEEEEEEEEEGGGEEVLGQNDLQFTLPLEIGEQQALKKSFHQKICHSKN